jgi:hypothetical protein
MNNYIHKDSQGNYLPGLGKAEALIKDGGTEIAEPENFVSDLICIFPNYENNEAALYCFNEIKFRFIKEELKTKRWVTHPYAKLLAKL